MHVPANLNSYWLLIKDLNTAEKLSLVELLIKSIRSAPPTGAKGPKKNHSDEKKDQWVLQFSGSWNDLPETAEEMIELIEGSRTLGRPIETL